MTTETFSSIRVLKPEEYSETKYDFVAEMVAASNQGVSYVDIMRAIVECVGMEFDLDWEMRWLTILNSSTEWGSKGDADGRLYEMDAIDIPAYVSDFPKSFYVGVIYPDELGSDDELLAAGFEIEENDEQAEELDMEFEEWMLNKYGPAWQVDTWAEVGADREAYNEEIQREFDLFINERNGEWA